MKLLQKDKIEIRKAFFLKAFGKEIENMSIISFGRCNFNCCYCKRDGQFKDENNNIIHAVDCSLDELKNIVQNEIAKNRRIRLSGGDPCMFQAESLEIAQFVWENFGQKISIAHNGSCPEFVKKLLPYLDYVAIDLKSPYADEFSNITGMKNGEFWIKNSLLSQEYCTNNNVLVDTRTCVFNHTGFDELKAIADLIVQKNNLKNLFWTIRCYNPVKDCDYQTPNRDVLLEYIQKIKEIYPDLKIGIRAKWKGGFEFF